VLYQGQQRSVASLITFLPHLTSRKTERNEVGKFHVPLASKSSDAALLDQSTQYWILTYMMSQFMCTVHYEYQSKQHLYVLGFMQNIQICLMMLSISPTIQC
jgi:predicted acyltransferase